MIDVMQENTNYIKTHVENVKKGYDFIKNMVPEMLEDCDINKLDKMIEEHDKSKWSKEEFAPYAEHFFGKFKGCKDEEDPDFQEAWKHHYMNNPHHPEYWNGKNMPNERIIEMICDWWSFSWKEKNLNEIFEHDEMTRKMEKFSAKTYITLKEKLTMLKRRLKILNLI